jgi:hypothetical protein
VAGTLALALPWRLFLQRRFFGWEESDYGNLAMIRGVLDGGFRHFDMNHMPGYYALGALALAVVGDPVVAARLVTLTGGLVAVCLAVALAERLWGTTAALLAALILVLQPELALYSSSSLREPVYAAWLLAMLLCLSRERLGLAGIFGALAFLVRMDGALAVVPVLAVHALGRGPRPGRLLRALLPMGIAVAAWATYTRIDHGTAMFWGHSVAVNVETGLGEEAVSRLDWLGNGLGVSARLGAWLLPWRLGWGTWLGLLFGLAAAPWTRHGLHRSWALLTLLLTGVWLGIGLVGQHSPDHNLYWKWLCPIVPLWVPLGVAGLLRLLRPLPRPLALVLGAALVLQGLGANLLETRRQVQRSVDWYKPQLELGRWFEAQVPPDQPLLIDGIPAVWIDRNPHARSLHSWFDVPTGGDPVAFAAWLAQERIAWVLWFAEDWTQAPVVAPFLAAGGTWSGGPVRLTETAREDGYGWILFRVDPAEAPAPPPAPTPSPSGAEPASP